MRTRLPAWLTIALWASFPASTPHIVLAHTTPYSWVDIRVTSAGIEGRITAHVVDLAHEIGYAHPDSLLVASRLEAQGNRLEDRLGTLLRLEADGSSVHPLWTATSAVPERQSIAFDFRVADTHLPGMLVLHGPLFRYDPAHETYFNVYVDGNIRHQDLLDAQRPESRFATGFRQTRLSVVRRFVIEGMHHIFIGPDHILFIVGLLLLGGGLRRLLKIITAFTLAHSVTLALAATGVVTPPARIIEPAIALSIIFVGADNLLRGERQADRRALLAGCFGLVHGFGFANVLRELQLPREALAWSLFSFNVGVEMGQACVVLAVAPLLGLLRKSRPAWAQRVVHLGSLGVVAAGAYWFVQRAFLS